MKKFLFAQFHVFCFRNRLWSKDLFLMILVNPLPGATVQIQGVDQVGAITNFDGEFSVILDSPDQSCCFIHWFYF